MGKANLETLLGNYDDAITSYDHAIKIDPGDADPWVGKGSAYLAARDYDDAIASFDRALVIHPDKEDALENLALAEQLKAAVLAGPDESTGEVSPGPADVGQYQANADGNSMEPGSSPGNKAPAEAFSVSVPGSAPSMLPMLVAIMAFAVIVYRRRDR
jgi:tetratricopeptide (TPR) repeat protein